MFRAETLLNQSCWCSVIALRIATAVLGEEKLLVCPVPHFYAAHLKPLRGFAVTEDIHLSQDMSPSTRTNSMNRRDLLMRSGQATPIPQGGNVSRRTLSNSLPALPSIPSDQFSDTGNHESDDCASATCQQGATTFSRRIVWTRKV